MIKRTIVICSLALVTFLALAGTEGLFVDLNVAQIKFAVEHDME